MHNIRNFAIIAHVDHGKSTLADRFLELAGVVKQGAHVEQFLDRNPISRERGITIKLAPVRMKYEDYTLNLIDTPGHVDFSYEVDRTLACVEGVILLVDATKGIQAQTVANAYKALEKNLVIMPVVNKIDLENAETEKTKQELKEFLGLNDEDVYLISAKTGEGVLELFKAVIERIPPPNAHLEEVQGLIFDSYYDSHRGAVAFVRVFGGQFQKKTKVKLVAAGQVFEISEVGIFTPELKEKERLLSGEIGYVVTNLKDIHKVRVGDTITTQSVRAISGYRKVKPMVFASMFPTDANEYLNLKRALEKLYLNDSSLEFSPINSRALGAGFRVGFLGLLHADITRERLEREYHIDVVLTPPQVEFQKKENEFFEPVVKLSIVVPTKYMNVVMRLCEEHRGRFITMDGQNHIFLLYEMPMDEMISDFFEKLKSVSSGFASLDWEFLRLEKVEADQMAVLLNGDSVDEFSQIVVKDKAQEKAQILARRLREVIPRQQYEIRIQARYKGKIIASERVAPFRKDVTQKLYGGDRTRKDKLLEKQKKGKKRMKSVGRVEIPKEAFLKLFKRQSS